MVSDEMFYRLSGQVQGLELALKTLVSFHLASQVKDESGFAKAADSAESIARYVRGVVEEKRSKAPQAAIETGVAAIMLNEMEATAARCFEQTAVNLDQVAQMILAVSDPASDAKN